MTPEIRKDIDELTQTIENAAEKPMLRSTLTLALRDLGHEPQAVEIALTEFFKQTVH